jgi:hypothetical protein
MFAMDELVVDVGDFRGRGCLLVASQLLGRRDRAWLGGRCRGSVNVSDAIRYVSIEVWLVVEAIKIDEGERILRFGLHTNFRGKELALEERSWHFLANNFGPELSMQEGRKAGTLGM